MKAISQMKRWTRLVMACAAPFVQSESAIGQARYVTEWSKSVGPSTGAALVKGACVRNGVLHVTALLGPQSLSEVTAVAYEVDARKADADAREIWRGGRALNSDSLSNPVCTAEGVTWVFNSKTEPAGRVVRKSAAGVVDSKPVNRGLGGVIALKPWIKGSLLIAQRDTRAVLVLSPEARIAEVAVPQGSSAEAVVDLCTLSDPSSAILLTFNQAGKPIGEIRLRKFDESLAMVETRTLRGNFGALACAASGIQVFHQQSTNDSKFSFAVAELDAGLNTKRVDLVGEANMASLFARGFTSADAIFWTTTNWKWPYVYESALGQKTRPIWRSNEKQWGATENPGYPAMDEGAVLITYEAVNRGQPDLPTVVRISRISKGGKTP